MVGNIILLIRTKVTDEETEILHARDTLELRVVKWRKKCNPSDENPQKAHFKVHEKWNKRAVGGQQWPTDGSFDIACSDKMEVSIKHHKAKDTSDKQIGRTHTDREVIRWFLQEGTNSRQ